MTCGTEQLTHRPTVLQLLSPCIFPFLILFRRSELKVTIKTLIVIIEFWCQAVKTDFLALTFVYWQTPQEAVREDFKLPLDLSYNLSSRSQIEWLSSFVCTRFLCILSYLTQIHFCLCKGKYKSPTMPKTLFIAMCTVYIIRLLIWLY